MKNSKVLSFAVIGCLTAGVALAGGLPVDDSAKTDTSAAQTQTTQTASPASTDTATSSSTSASDNAYTTDSGASDNAASGGGFVAIEDDPLVVDVSAIMDDDGMGNIQVQWQISDTGASWRNLPGVIQQ